MTETGSSGLRQRGWAAVMTAALAILPIAAPSAQPVSGLYLGAGIGGNSRYQGHGEHFD